MHNVLLKFTFENQEEIDFDTPTWLLISFYQNGQLIDYFGFPVIKDNTLIYSGVIFQPDALDIRYYTPTAMLRLKQFKEDFHIKFEYEIIGMLPSHTVNNLNDVSAFILYEGSNSPVRSIDTFENVPLYLLPKTSACGENYYNIICWKRDYEATYGLWAPGYDEHYDQLTNYKSGLSQRGLEICNLISSRTNKDCYYHLFRDPDPDVPDFENCPKCNSPWKLEHELFDRFLYKCTKCFLIS